MDTQQFKTVFLQPFFILGDFIGAVKIIRIPLMTPVQMGKSRFSDQAEIFLRRKTAGQKKSVFRAISIVKFLEFDPGIQRIVLSNILYGILLFKLKICRSASADR